MVLVWTLTAIGLAVDTVRNQRLRYLNPARARSEFYSRNAMRLGAALGPVLLVIVGVNAWFLRDASADVLGLAVVTAVAGVIAILVWLFQVSILVLLPFATTANASASLLHTALSGEDIAAPVLQWLYGMAFGDGGELVLQLWKLAVAVFGTVILVRLGMADP
jgi:hypothetical protein